jgi:hypothetical protein
MMAARALNAGVVWLTPRTLKSRPMTNTKVVENREACWR